MELEQARADAEGLRRRVTMMRNRAYPREQRRAQVVLEQRTAQVESARQRHVESNALVASLRTAIDASHIYTKCAGLVVYEEFLTANPRRKVRVGDRVTATQGLVTIPELDAMLLDTSVRESDIARIQTGQVVGIEVDAFRSTKFRGRVTAIGALGRTSIDRPFEEKRFDVTIAVEGSDHQLRPEMTARATIVVDERKQALLIPVSALFEASGRRVVYVIRHGRHEVRRVTIGQSDDVQVEITGGLEAGELVALTDGAGSLLTLSTRP
jgi:RND family efflux transporter MFP subunit